MTPPRELVTADGYDLQFGTNVIGTFAFLKYASVLNSQVVQGHFLFTELLMPALIAGKDTSPDKHARVITTSSAGAYPGSLHWDTFKDDPARRKMTTYSLYYQSKFVRSSHHISGVCVRDCYNSSRQMSWLRAKLRSGTQTKESCLCLATQARFILNCGDTHRTCCSGLWFVFP